MLYESIALPAELRRQLVSLIRLPSLPISLATPLYTHNYTRYRKNGGRGHSDYRLRKVTVSESHSTAPTGANKPAKAAK